MAVTLITCCDTSKTLCYRDCHLHRVLKKGNSINRDSTAMDRMQNYISEHDLNMCQNVNSQSLLALDAVA